MAQTRENLRGPSDIEIDLIGKNIYVADTYNHRIQVFDLDGHYKLAFGSEGKGDGEFNYPEGIAVDPTDHNRIYVADTGNERIQMFDSDGNHQITFGQIGKSPGEFYLPKGIAIDSIATEYTLQIPLITVSKSLTQTVTPS